MDGMLVGITLVAAIGPLTVLVCSKHELHLIPYVQTFHDRTIDMIFKQSNRKRVNMGEGCVGGERIGGGGGERPTAKSSLH